MVVALSKNDYVFWEGVRKRIVLRIFFKWIIFLISSFLPTLKSDVLKPVKLVKISNLKEPSKYGLAILITSAFIFILTSSALFALTPVIFSVDVIPNNANTTDDLSCTVQATHPLNSTFVLNVTWYNGSTQFTQADYNNGSYANNSVWTVPINVLSGNTSKGEIWNCSATFRDVDQVDFVNVNGSETIANAPPNVTGVSISPAGADTSDTLTGSGTYGDHDGDGESGSTYKWYKNGGVIAGETSTTLSPGNFTVGDVIIFEYTPNDGATAGAAVNSSTLVIANVAGPVGTPQPSGGDRKLTAVVLANSIDFALASEFFGFLRNQGIELTYSTATEFPKNTQSKFIIILGGPDASEGVGEIVQEVLEFDEEEYLRTPGNRKMYVKTNVWNRHGQIVRVIGGSGRDFTKEESDANQDDVAYRIKYHPVT